jgi:branched-chain amino acid transport system substrate-binding protein
MAYSTAYEARFKQPVSAFGGYAHDALLLVADAIKRGGSAEPQAIRDNLEKITAFVGASGIFTFSPQDHLGLDESAFVMVKIEKGDWKVVD